MRAVAHIALKVAEVEGILDRLLLFVNHSRPAVAQEAVAVMADMLRRFPDAAGACVPAIAEVDPETLDLPASRAALVWVLGEFGETVQDAPYTLESLAQGFSEESSEVKLALLTGVAKLFFKRAPECRVALGHVLVAGAVDEDATVRFRALFYHRLLSQAGPGQAKIVIAAPRPPMARFEDSISAEVQDRIFDELNTLSTIYRAPAATFIDAGDIGERHETDSIGGGEIQDSEAGASSEALDGGTALLLDLGGGDSTGGGNGSGFGGVGGDTEGSEGGGSFLMQTTGGGGGGNGPSMDSSLSELDFFGLGGSGAGGSTGGGVGVDPYGATTSGTSAPRSSAMGGGGTGVSGLEMMGDFGASPAVTAAPQPQQQQQNLGDMLGDFFGSAVPPSNNNQQQEQQPSFNTRAAGLGAGAGAVSPSEGGLGDDLDAFFGGLGGPVSNTSAGTASAPQQAPQHAQQAQHEDIQLIIKPTISPSEFQSSWAMWENPATTTTTRQELGGPAALAALSARGFREFSEHVGQANIATFAAPKEASTPPLRFLLHAQRKGGSGARILAQIVVNSSPEPVASITVKSSDMAAAAYVQELLQTLLLTL